MTTAPALAAALQAHKPALVESYCRIVRGQFARAVQDLGATLPAIGNDWTWAKVWRETLRPVAHQPGATSMPAHNATLAWVLDESRLLERARAYADAVVESWEGKIQGKLGELEGAEVHAMTGLAFTITGTRAGRRVRIEQTCIINVSPLGKLFNQFPARIYLDGKFTSEAAFRKLAA